MTQLEQKQKDEERENNNNNNNNNNPMTSTVQHQHQQQERVLFMSDLSPTWKAETIALLVNKFLVTTTSSGNTKPGEEEDSSSSCYYSAHHHHQTTEDDNDDTKTKNNDENALLPGQIRVTPQPQQQQQQGFEAKKKSDKKKEKKKKNGGEIVMKLEFASKQECQEVKDCYQGLVIPNTHGYHHYQFHESWPPSPPPSPPSSSSSPVDSVVENNNDNDNNNNNNNHKTIHTKKRKKEIANDTTTSTVITESTTQQQQQQQILFRVPSPPLHLQIMAVPHKELRRRLSKTQITIPQQQENGHHHNEATTTTTTTMSVENYLKTYCHQKCKVWIHCFLVHTFLNSTLVKGILQHRQQRKCHYQQVGIPVRKEWTDRLLEVLRNIPIAPSHSNQQQQQEEQRLLCWPPISKQRKGVQSSHYLTIRKKHPPNHDSIWELCRDLLYSTLLRIDGGKPRQEEEEEEEEEPSFHYNALAITKNFIGSPHIDFHDQTYQYVIAVGDFIGGQLCCEMEYDDDNNETDNDNDNDNDAVPVTGGDGIEEIQIDIHNRLGRMDGRKVHWVNSWKGNERYSVVYYNTNQKQYTPPQPQSFHVEWMQNKIKELEEEEEEKTCTRISVS